MQRQIGRFEAHESPSQTLLSLVLISVSLVDSSFFSSSLSTDTKYPSRTRASGWDSVSMKQGFWSPKKDEPTDGYFATQCPCPATYLWWLRQLVEPKGLKERSNMAKVKGNREGVWKIWTAQITGGNKGPKGSYGGLQRVLDLESEVLVFTPVAPFNRNMTQYITSVSLSNLISKMGISMERLLWKLSCLWNWCAHCEVPCKYELKGQSTNQRSQGGWKYEHGTNAYVNNNQTILVLRKKTVSRYVSKSLLKETLKKRWRMLGLEKNSSQQDNKRWQVRS